MQEKIYNEVWDKAFKSAFYILKEKNDADDIAQIWTIKYFTNKKKVDNPLAWVTTVAKREAIKKYQNNNLLNLEMGTLVDPSTEYASSNLDKYTDADYEEPENLDLQPEEAKELLNKDDFIIYKLISKHGSDINKIANKLKISYQATNNRIYKAKRNLKTAKLLKEGYRGTKNIVNYQFNKNIIKFLNILKKKMNENDLKSLKKYFCNYDTEQIVMISIIKNFEYEIKKINVNRFEIYIPYMSTTKKIQMIQMLIIIDKFNHIKC